MAVSLRIKCKDAITAAKKSLDKAAMDYFAVAQVMEEYHPGLSAQLFLLLDGIDKMQKFSDAIDEQI